MSEERFLSQSLKPLRDDLELHEGPVDRNGASTWTVFDPVVNKFYRIGWMEFEILKRWSLGTPKDILDNVREQTTIDVGQADVEKLARFLQKNHLLAGYGSQTEQQFLETHEALRGSRTAKALQQYMFFRIPLLNPTRMLAAIHPASKVFFTREFVYTVIVLAALALYLVSRQWGEFSNSFVHFFSFSGLVFYAVMIFFAKAVHEMGHAMTAHHFGCRVPTMGIAFLVFFPVLYTDTTDAWKLADKKKRLLIGAVGVLAVVAALLWVVLPEGVLRTMAFLLASTTWILTLFINLNPFMRFDGYFILSDWLGIENMHQRAMRWAKWHIRKILFKGSKTKPESEHERFLIIFGYAIWAYRLFIFSVISLLLYFLLFKALAVCLIAMNFYFMILSPILRQLVEWREDMGRGTMAPRTFRWAGIAVFAALLLFLPWQNRVRLNAAIYPAMETAIYAEYAGLITQLHVEDGQEVKAGDMLAMIKSPDLEFEIALLERRLKVLEWQYEIRGMDKEVRERSLVIQSEIDSVKTSLDAARKKLQSLSIRAEHDGRVQLATPDLQPGLWVKKNEKIMSLYDFKELEIRAYAYEQHVERLEGTQKGYFYLSSAPEHSFEIEMKVIEDVGVTRIYDPLFVSVYEGPVAVRTDKRNNYVPEIASFPVRFSLVPGQGQKKAIQQVERGVAVVEGKAQSIFSRALTRIWSVIIREGGF